MISDGLAELVAVLTFLGSSTLVLGAFRFFGAIGLIVYATLMFILANQAALKLGSFFLLSEPVALGTTLFSSVYVSFDLLTEYYGLNVALRALFLSFLAYALWILGLWSIIAIPVVAQMPGQMIMHQALTTVFMPAPALLGASLVAYLCSQLSDITLFSYCKKRTQAKALWLRSGMAMMISSFLDTLIFSACAWRFFAVEPLEWSIIWSSYIGGTYCFRMLMALGNIPLMYVARSLRPADLPHSQRV